jgi:hypothetical protein
MSIVYSWKLAIPQRTGLFQKKTKMLYRNINVEGQKTEIQILLLGPIC